MTISITRIVILSDRNSKRECAGPGTYSGGHFGSSSVSIKPVLLGKPQLDTSERLSDNPSRYILLKSYDKKDL